MHLQKAHEQYTIEIQQMQPQQMQLWFAKLSYKSTIKGQKAGHPYYSSAFWDKKY